MAIEMRPFTGLNADYRTKSDASSGTSFLNLKLTHEIESIAQDHVQSDAIVIPASKLKTVVKLTSVVDFSFARKTRSDAFISAQRRHGCKEILSLVVKLDQKPTNIAWGVATHSLHARICELIKSIQPAKAEANAREVLRQIRDTLMNGQWERYESKNCRQTVANILESTSKAVKVEMDFVLNATNQLESVGFTICGFALKHEQEAS